MQNAANASTEAGGPVLDDDQTQKPVHLFSNLQPGNAAQVSWASGVWTCIVQLPDVASVTGHGATPWDAMGDAHQRVEKVRGLVHAAKPAA